MTTSRCPRSRSTRRDPLPYALRSVRHRPWLFRFGALRLLCGLVVILGRLSRCYSFFLAFPSAVCGVGALGVLVRCKGIISTYTRASAATGQPKTASTAVGPSAVGRRPQFDVGHNGRQCGGEAASDCAVPSPPAAAHSSRLARKPGSRLRTGAALVTVASSRSNCSSDGKMLFLHLLALRGTLEEGRPPKTHDPHPIPYPSYLTTRRLIGYPGRQWVSGYP